MTDALQIQAVPVSTLTPDPDNARAHGEENLSAIRGSLARFGQVKPIVVDSSGKVLAGNATLRVAIELGFKKVDVVRVPEDWTPEQGMAYAIADNRTAELAEWDDKVLASQLVDLDAAGWDLAELGFVSLTPPTTPGAATPGGMLGGESSSLLRCPSCGFEWQDVKGEQA